MEIQFSVPVRGPGQQARKGSSPTSSSPSSSGSAGGTALRGGTFRFALESRTRHTRKSSTRARTGCSTCKKRHVKCDETKPACQNCVRWRGYCDGYASAGGDGADNDAEERGRKAELIHTKKAPLVLVEPAVNSIRFRTEEQWGYFDAWTSMSVTFLSGGLEQTRLWSATMPQVSLEETTLRYAAMAVGALRRALDESPLDALTTDNKHYLNAVVYYCEALKMQSKAQLSREGLRTALLSSLLFICFESQRGNLQAALKHIVHGFSMLNELAACTQMAPDLVRMAQAPPTMVQEILDCYKPLELQSRSFMGSYKKFFFQQQQQKEQFRQSLQQQQQQQQQQQGTDAWMHAAGPPSAPDSSSMASQSPQSQPQTPGNPHATQHLVHGLPSPQSTSSSTGLGSPAVPISTTLDSSNTRTLPPQPGALPPTPPRIAPFSKHSPYFRPKQSDIHALTHMPHIFETYDEARGYWTLLQKQMVGSLPLLTAFSAQLGLAKAKDEVELEEKLESIKSHQRIQDFVAESRFWLQRWIEAFDPYFRKCARNRPTDPQAYLQAADIRIEYLVLYIYTTLPRFTGIITANGLTPQYKELIYLAEQLLAARPHCGFAMDSGWTWPLFVAAFGCRDYYVREAAMNVLAKYPIRNALRDSRVFRAIALRNQEVELATLQEGTEHEQWLRLRRREVVFEDFGTHIVYRSAQKNPSTGVWDLVEEIADFHVNRDGTLNWKRQPISEAASIMLGVC